MSSRADLARGARVRVVERHRLVIFPGYGPCMSSKRLAAIVVVATGLLTSCGSDDASSSAAVWVGHLTITLPPSLATPGKSWWEGCSGRAGTMWSDIRSNAPARIRADAGRELAHWTLPPGTTHITLDGFQAPRGCSFVLSAADAGGIPPSKRAYQLVVAGHTLRIPGRKLTANTYVVLPDRVFRVLIPVR